MLEWFRAHVERLQIQSNIIRFWHRVVVGVCIVSLILQAAGWIVSTMRHQLLGRHIAAIIGFCLTIFTLILNHFTLNAEPQMLLMFGLQLLCLISLIITSAAAGTLAIVVDLCHWKEQSQIWSCGATVMEYFAAWVTCICLCLIFASTQKKIIMLVDRGILNGIGTRLSKI